MPPTRAQRGRHQRRGLVRDRVRGLCGAEHVFMRRRSPSGRAIRQSRAHRGLRWARRTPTACRPTSSAPRGSMSAVPAVCVNAGHQDQLLALPTCAARENLGDVCVTKYAGGLSGRGTSGACTGLRGGGGLPGAAHRPLQRPSSEHTAWMPRPARPARHGAGFRLLPSSFGCASKA